MGFNRNNYIRIKEEYNGKYRRAEEEAKLRRHEVELGVPGVKEIPISKTYGENVLRRLVPLS